MGLIIFVIYLIVGGVLCYLLKANYGDCFKDSFGDDQSTMVSIVTGVFWPIMAPFIFAIAFAKKKGGK